MINYTLVIMIAFGYDFQKTSTAVSVNSVHGFTTEQACLNAAQKIKQDAVTGWDWIHRKMSLSCVATTI